MILQKKVSHIHVHISINYNALSTPIYAYYIIRRNLFGLLHSTSNKKPDDETTKTALSYIIALKITKATKLLCSIYSTT